MTFKGWGSKGVGPAGIMVGDGVGLMDRKMRKGGQGFRAARDRIGQCGFWL